MNVFTKRLEKCVDKDNEVIFMKMLLKIHARARVAVNHFIGCSCNQWDYTPDLDNERCNFCGKRLCLECFMLCDRCDNCWCGNCAIDKFDGTMDENRGINICKSCL